MSTAYWNQWDSTEIMSLHGIEPEEEESQDDCQDDGYEADRHELCSPSMYSLGISWRDFM